MNMIDMVIQFAKELRGMQIGNRNMQLKVNNLKRQLSELHETVRRWKKRHQVQHDIAECALLELYNQYPRTVMYFAWKYDYLRRNGIITEEITSTVTAKTQWVDMATLDRSDD